MKRFKIKSIITKRESVRTLSLFLLVSFVSCANQNSTRVLDIKTFTSVISEGDVVLKCGYGQISRLITKGLNEEIPLSHVGIVILEHEEYHILHSVSGSLAENDGVQKIRLEEFLKDIKKESLYVLRPKIDPNALTRVIELSKAKLLDNTPFDHELNNEDSSQLYCSEYIQFVFEQGADLSCFETKALAEKEVYTFNSLLKNNNFKLIYTW